MKKILLILSGLLILIAIPITVFIVGQNQELRKKAAPATTLYFSKSQINASVGDTITLDLMIDTGINQVIAISAEVSYDQTKLLIENPQNDIIGNDTIFPSNLETPKTENGVASFSIGTRSNTTPYTGITRLASIRFKATGATSVPIKVEYVLPNTMVVGVNDPASATNSMLTGTTPVSITINSVGTASLASVSSPAVSPSPTISITTTISPTNSLLSPTATPSGSIASPSAMRILSPIPNASVKSSRPTITGKALPNATVTLTIYSNPITAIVLADASGNWSYTPSTDLDTGPHTVIASSLDASSKTQTTSSMFIVSTSSYSSPLKSSTESAVPTSGNTDLTILLLLLGCMFIVFGGINIRHDPVVMKKEDNGIPYETGIR